MFTGSGKNGVGHRWKTHELFARHEHLLRPHATARWIGASILSAFRPFVCAHDCPVLDYDRRCAEEFGRLNAALRRVGNAVALADLLIASVAVANQLTLVTHNTRDFAQIPGLQLEDWLSP